MPTESPSLSPALSTSAPVLAKDLEHRPVDSATLAEAKSFLEGQPNPGLAKPNDVHNKTRKLTRGSHLERLGGGSGRLRIPSRPSPLQRYRRLPKDIILSGREPGDRKRGKFKDRRRAWKAQATRAGRLDGVPATRASRPQRTANCQPAAKNAEKPPRRAPVASKGS